MNPRTVLAGACALLFTAALSASQSSSGAAQDPVSGQWGQNGVPYLELQFDGSAVTGTVIFRHDGQEAARSAIKTGSFDVKTGALKLEGEIKRPEGDDVVPYVIEGTIEKETVSGTYKVGKDHGQFTFKKLGSAKSSDDGSRLEVQESRN